MGRIRVQPAYRKMEHASERREKRSGNGPVGRRKCADQKGEVKEGVEEEGVDKRGIDINSRALHTQADAAAGQTRQAEQTKADKQPNEAYRQKKEPADQQETGIPSEGRPKDRQTDRHIRQTYRQTE